MSSDGAASSDPQPAPTATTDAAETQEKFELFDKLAHELKLSVFSQLSGPDLERAAATCKEWRQLANTDSLWKNRCAVEWGILEKTDACPTWKSFYTTIYNAMDIRLSRYNSPLGAELYSILLRSMENEDGDGVCINLSASAKSVKHFILAVTDHIHTGKTTASHLADTYGGSMLIFYRFEDSPEGDADNGGAGGGAGGASASTHPTQHWVEVRAALGVQLNEDSKDLGENFCLIGRVPAAVFKQKARTAIFKLAQQEPEKFGDLAEAFDRGAPAGPDFDEDYPDDGDDDGPEVE